jgi:polyhydroxyalkanoate synthase subunit PhaC
MLEGPLAALDAIEQATGEKEVNVIGYCLGGTLLACTLAYMAAKKDNRIKAATFFTTCSTSATRRARRLHRRGAARLPRGEDGSKGYLEGAEMATTFNMLRANDLIWSFVVNNYLLGKEPFPSTCSTGTPTARACRRRCTASTCATCTREPAGRAGRHRAGGVPIDLRKMRCRPTGSRPRRTTSRPGRRPTRRRSLLGGPVKRFVLAGSGHIAGVINPPASGKYGYWLNDELPPTRTTGYRQCQQACQPQARGAHPRVSRVSRLRPVRPSAQ